MSEQRATFTFNGEQVEVWYFPTRNNKVSSLSHWELWIEMVNAGIFTTKDLGPNTYGDTALYFQVNHV